MKPIAPAELPRYYTAGGQAIESQPQPPTESDYYVKTTPEGKRQLYARRGSALTLGIGREVYDAAIAAWDATPRGGTMERGAPRPAGARGGRLESQLPPEQQGQEFGLPPGGPDTLRGKFAAFMGSPLGKAAQAAPMALTGALVGGGLGGPVGALVGGALGAVGGVALPAYQQNEMARLAASYGWAEAQRRFDEENVVGQALRWLDVPRATLEQAVGTAAQIGEAATADIGREVLKQYGVSTDVLKEYSTTEEVFKNLGAAWKAARLTYESAPVGLSGVRGDEQVWVDYDLPEANGGLLPLVEARRRIAAGEDATAVYNEIATRYGVPGQLRELASGLLADPLNLVNVVETRGLGLVGRALKDADLVEAAARTATRPGLFATREAYRNLLLLKPVREGLEVGREFTALQRWVLGKELLNLAEKGAYTPPKWWQLGRLTPESAAKETVFRAHDMLGTLVAQLPNDETLAARVESLIGSFKHADLDNLPKDFPEAARLGLSIEGRVVRRSINDAAVLDRTQAWTATAPERQLLGDLAAVAGEKPERVLARIAGGEADALLRELAAKAGEQGDGGAALVEKIQDGSLNANVLSEMAKTFGEDGVPYTPEMLKAAVMEGLIEASGAWAVKTFGVKSADWVTRFAQAVKGVESVALLGLNIPYPIRNLWNGEATVIVDGVWGLRGIGEITQEWERLGVLPARAMAGMGAADIGADISSTAIGARAVRAGLTQIEKATQTAGILTEIREAAARITDKLPPTHVAQQIEKWQGARAFYEGFRQMWSQLRQKDVTIPRLPQSVEAGLRAVDPRLPDYLYAAARAGYNPAEITAAVLSDAPPVVLHTFYGEAARAVGITDGDVARLMALDGVGDALNDGLAKLGPKARPGDIARVFDRTRRAAEAAIAKQIEAETAVITERAATVPGVEGALGVMNVTDEIEVDLLNTFTRHAQNLDRRWAEVYREGKPKAAVMKALFAEADQVWTNYQAREVAAYTGLAEGMAKAEMGLSPDFLPAVRGKQAAVRGFNDTRTRLLRTFFDTEHAPGTRTAAWAETTRAIDQAYFDLALELERRQGVMDEYLTAAYRARAGEAVGEGVRAWREAVRRFNQEDMARVREFRRTVRGLPEAAQAKAWTDFHNERLRLRWAATEELINVRRGIAPAAVSGAPVSGESVSGVPVSRVTSPTPGAVAMSADIVTPAPEVTAAQQAVAGEVGLREAEAGLRESVSREPVSRGAVTSVMERTLNFQQALAGGRVQASRQVGEVWAEVVEDFPGAVRVRTAEGREVVVPRGEISKAEVPAGRVETPAPEAPTAAALSEADQAALNANRERGAALLKQVRSKRRKANKLYRQLFKELAEDPQGLKLDEMNRLRTEALQLEMQAQLMGDMPITRARLLDEFLDFTGGDVEQADAGLALVEARARAAGVELGEYLQTHFALEGEGPELFQAAVIRNLGQAEGDLTRWWRDQSVPSAEWQTRMDALRAAGAPGGATPQERTLAAQYLSALGQAQAAHPEGPFLYQPLEGAGPKGAARFLEDGRAVLRALESPDVSTLAHELGHVFRRDLGQADLGRVTTWLKDEGVEVTHSQGRFIGDEAAVREAEERFSRGFERYLAEGVAPTAGLRAVFEQFKRWLMAIYQQITGSAIDVRLTPELRAVFDRLLAENPEMARTLEAEIGGVRASELFQDGALQDLPGGRGAFELPNGEHARLLGRNGEGETVARNIESGEAVIVEGGTGTQTRPYLPPGTLDQLTGGGPMPHAQAREEAWYDRMLPLLGELQKRAEGHVAQGSVRGHAGLPPELQAGVRDWLGQVNSGLAEAKLHAIKWGQFKRDAGLLNYSRRYQFNNFLGLAFPYEFFMTHSMLQWAMRAIDKPALLANYYRLQKFLNTEVTKPGFPSRLAGRVRIPFPFQSMAPWMGGGMFVDPMSLGLPLNQFFAPWEQAQQATTRLETRATRKLEDMVANGQISQAEYSEALTSKTGTAWARAVQLAQSDEDQQQFDGVDFASLIVGPHLPLSWAYNVARGTPEQIQPLPGTRQLKALTAALGIGPAGGVNVEAGLRRHFGLPLFDQWEDYRIDRELANLAAEGRATPQQANAAMIERSGPLFEEAQRRAARVGGFGTITGMIFGTSAGVFPEGEQRQRLLGELIRAAHQAQDNGDPDALANFFEAHPEYEARLALNNKPEERIKNFLVDTVWQGYNNLPELYKREVRAQFGQTFADAFISPDTRSYDSIPTDTLAAWARTLGRYVPLNVEGEPIQLELSPPEVAMEAQQYYALRKQFFGDPMITALQSAYFQIPEHARATDKPMPPAVDDYYRLREQMFPDNAGLWDLYHNLPEVLRNDERDRLFPGIFQLQDAYFALPERGKERKAFREAHPELVQYWDWNRAYKAAHPEEQLRSQFFEQFPQLKQQLTWQEAFYSKHPEVKAYLDITDVSARAAFLEAHPELKQYWDFRRGWLDAHPVSAPWITEQAPAAPTPISPSQNRPSPAAESPQERGGSQILASPEMQALVMAHLFAGEPLEGAAYRILRDEFVRQGGEAGKDERGRGNLDAWLIQVVAFGGNLGGESYTYGDGGAPGGAAFWPSVQGQTRRSAPTGSAPISPSQNRVRTAPTRPVAVATGAPTGGNAAPNPYATTPTGGLEGVMRWADMAAQYGQQYGVPPEFILALIKAESGGNEFAVGDAGHSVGLFQLYAPGGVGHGLTVEQRYNPVLQFELMMPRIAAAYQSGVAAGLSGRNLAMHVGKEAERPAAAAVPRYGVAYDEITGVGR